MLTQERLKELLSYNSETGIFINLTQRARCVKKGCATGNKYSNGYIYIELDSCRYLAHRLAWLYIYGSFPEKYIDHINGNKCDNRVANLRLATEQENQHNQSCPQTNNKSGFRGVSWHKWGQKWIAQISLNGKTKYIGLFNTAEEAYEAYLKAKRELHPFWVEEKVA